MNNPFPITDIERYQNALKDGYLYSLFQNDELALAWTIVAESEGFPFVAVSPRQDGVCVTCFTNPDRLDHKVTMFRLRNAVNKAVRNANAATVTPHDDGMFAGPFPAHVALNLARKIAGLTGRKFPITTGRYVDVIAQAEGGRHGDNC